MGGFKMGDLGKWDEQGNLQIVGRKKEMIIRGGQNIYPFEIEEMLSSYKKIRNVAIVGIPDKQMGERVCACIIVNSKNEIITLEEIVAFLREKGVSSYKFPERIEIIDQMPMIAGGQKVDRKALANNIAKKLKAEETI
jgi:non-ribosomal peptide synthetase component E (peptide arylation enzyme)